MYIGNCIAAAMRSKLEPTIWSRDTGHIGLHGEVDGRTVAKSQTGLPYFLTHGASRTPSGRIAPLLLLFPKISAPY